MPPSLTMDEHPSEYRIVVEVPDGQSIEINTEVSGQTLSVSGTMVSSVEESRPGSGMTLSSVSSQFARSMLLPDDADEASIEVEQGEDAVVITLPKKVT